MATRKHPNVSWTQRSFTPGAADTFSVSGLQNSLEALSEAAPFVGPTVTFTPIAGDLWADTSTNTLKQYTGTAWITVNFGLPSNTLLVYPGGPFGTLSAALASITTATATNRYAIWVFGRISETASIVPKAYVDVVGYNARVEMTSVTSGQAVVNWGNTLNVTWRNLTLVRMGALTGASSTPVIFFQSSPGADSTVILDNVICRNESTLGSGTPAPYGIYFSNTNAPTLRNCQAIMATTGAMGGGNALIVLNNAAPNVEGGLYRGLSASTAGGSFQNSCKGTYKNVTFDGGAGLYGGVMNHYCSPSFDNCTFLGGVGTGGIGAYNLHASTARYKNCRFVAGPTGNGAYGFACLSIASPELVACVSEPGSGGTGAAYFYDATSRARMSQCQAIFPQPVLGTQQFAATGTFILDATRAAQLETFYLNVDVAAAGATVSIGTTAGGTDIVNAQDASTTGIKFPTPGAALSNVIAANGTLFVTITGAATVTVFWSAVFALSSSYGLIINTANVTGWIDGSTFAGSATAAGIRFNANPTGDFRITNSTALARNRTDTTRNKGATAAAAYNPAPLYRCVFIGGQTNLTCAAGTANGSSIEA